MECNDEYCKEYVFKAALSYIETYKNVVESFGLMMPDHYLFINLWKFQDLMRSVNVKDDLS